MNLSNSAGFKPQPGDIWFIFIKDNRLWIGSVHNMFWRSKTRDLWEDPDETIYQQQIGEEDKVKVHQLRERDVFGRDRKIALKRWNL